ncbi:ATP-binding cassette domain-containing protein [Paenarthrobacter sp. PH39-S1]|uniref:ABC transporter ATP-binding protein n=1 Tax=Paenarthrobacter sp. PH39-S1 TaxID=3046204 RepID=UPI0024BB0A2E|nr:ATP-binding cassette domain-containing protein [Paenarthrobacter sp. PH39-S1]MDJ0357387.1 ATP-binding cassette domain-containing protein [Paenarthrobacter sp. PH39-S1]
MRLSLETFYYPGEDRPTLQGIELDVGASECVLVAGGSGSGKSTLARILAGVLPGRHNGALTARFEVAGESLVFSGASSVNPRINPAVWNRHIAYVGQIPSAQLSTVAATVAEEIAFALENAGMEHGLMKQRVRTTASALGLTELLERKPSELSGGEQRRMIIASAAALNPATLVLDEPMAGLDADARRAVENVIGSLLDRGAGVVLLSPELGGAGRLAGRMLLLDGGKMVASGPRPAVLKSAWAARLPVIPDPLDAPDRAENILQPPCPTSSARTPAAALGGVVYRYGTERRRPFLPSRKRAKTPTQTVLDGVDLALGAGERVAIAGANGAGKTTLLRHLNGLARPESGTVRILDRDIAGQSVGNVSADVSYLFQDPQDQLFERTVAREVGYGLPELDPAAREAAIKEALRRCGLAELAGAHPYELPASAQRLVALATVLARRPAVLVMDEPTVATDRDGLDRLAEAISQESARGAAVALVTHDLDFAYRHCNRLVLLSGGRIVADGPFARVLERHFAGGEAFGVQAPAAWLRRREP